MKTAYCMSALMCPLFLAVWSGDVMAAGGGESTEMEFRQYERDIPSLYLLNGLNFSKEQAGKLAKLTREARLIDEDHAADAERALKRYGNDVDKAVEELVDRAARGRDIDFAKEMAGGKGERLRKVKQEFGALMSDRCKKIDALADKTYDLMTPSQRDIFSRFKPCFIPAADFKNPERVGQAAVDTSVTEKALERLRQVSEAKLDEAKEVALERLTMHAMEQRHMQYSEDARDTLRHEISGRMNGVLPKMRQMSDADFALNKQDLAKKVVPPEAVAGKADDKGSARWKIGTYLLNPGNTAVLEARAGGAAGGKSSTTSYCASCVNEKAKDIAPAVRSAAVLSELKLTKEQANGLLAVVSDVMKRKAEIDVQAAEARGKALDPYRQLKRELADGQPTQKSEGEANRGHGSVKKLYEEKFRKIQLDAEAKVDQLLGADQVALLAKMKQDLKETLARDTEVDVARRLAHRALLSARKMGSAQFDREKTDLCKNLIKSCVEECGWKQSDVDAETEATRGIEVLERARKMRSVAFSNSGNDLAGELCPRRSAPRSPTYGTKYHGGEPVQMPTQVSKLLFNETATKILEKRAKIDSK